MLTCAHIYIKDMQRLCIHLFYIVLSYFCLCDMEFFFDRGLLCLSNVVVSTLLLNCFLFMLHSFYKFSSYA